MQWHLIRDPADSELDRLAERYGLHPLHIEDCRHRNQAAKIESDGPYLFTVLKPAHIDPDGTLNIGDLDIFLGPDWLITVEEADFAETRQLLDHLRASSNARRIDQVFHRIIDGVVDAYLPVLDHFENLLDRYEDCVLEHPTPSVLAGIFDVKRGLVMLRRLLVNTRDVASHLLRVDCPLLQRDMLPFFRDVYDHVARALDMTELLRDLQTGVLELYLSSIANRTNEVMKVLTVLSTIALPVLMITGFYGMNVQGLPFAEHAWGAGIAAAIMAAGCALLLLLLRYLRWF